MRQGWPEALDETKSLLSGTCFFLMERMTMTNLKKKKMCAGHLGGAVS